MLLSSPHHSAEKFTHPIAPGLRSLLLAPPSGGVVVTRAIAAASRGCGGEGGVQESRDVTSIDHEEENAEEEEEEEEDVITSDEEDEQGYWVSYGRREPRRRLPPRIPSLLARGAMRRTRTQDGRLVIRVAPVVWRECIRARRRGGRLTMQLVEHRHRHDYSPLTPPSPREGDVRAVEEPDDDTSSSPTTVTGEAVDDNTSASVPAIGLEGGVDQEEPAAAREMFLPVVPPPRVPSAGCFEDVFKYGYIGGRSLHQMPSLRMVH